MSIDDLLKNCVERGLTEEGTVREFVSWFPKNTIGRMGGRKRIRELYRNATSKSTTP
jgi:hypothetical protein